MKLLMVARRYPPDVRSGTETVFANLYRLARERHEVRLVVGYRNSRDQVPPEAVAVDLRGRGKAEQWARIYVAARREARRFRPDACLANSIEAPALGCGTAVIVHDLNFGSSGRSVGTIVRERFYKTRARQVSAVITVTEAARRALIRASMPEDRVHVIHNGVDLDTFSPGTPTRPPDDQTVHFAYPSRILQGKGQHLAIDAVARLPKLHKRRARLAIVGAVADSIFLDQLRIQAYEQPVDFHTDVPSIAPYYQDADVVLFPTLMTEGFGYTAVEAMACGKPVIWSEQPAIREATGGIGLAVDQGDVDAMRDHMKALMDDPSLRARIGREGRAFVEERYGWARVWGRYEALLEGMRV